MTRVRMMKQTEQLTSAQAFQEFIPALQIKNLSPATTK
jgi:hypothetical protein